MRIAIIGAGGVGSTLGRCWAKVGHTIDFGVRHPDKPAVRDLIAAIGPGKARAIAPRDAAQASDVVVLATPWAATIEAARGLGPLVGKPVVDCTNPLTRVTGKPTLEIGHATSGAEQIAAALPGVSLFKGFNHVGFGIMAEPRFKIGAAAMLVVGDDATLKPTVLTLVGELGFDAIDAGPLSAARLLEPLAMLWIHLSQNCGFGYDFAFVCARR